MKRVNLTAVVVVSFGQDFIKFSGGGAVAQANPLKAVCELLRTFVLAYVVARLLLRLNVSN